MLSPAPTQLPRATSSERSSRVGNDPVLAKYHAIKREIENQARSRPQTPSRQVTRHPLTPETRALLNQETRTSLSTDSTIVHLPDSMKARQLESEVRLKELENAALKERIESAEAAARRIQTNCDTLQMELNDAHKTWGKRLHDAEMERDQFRHQVEELRVELSQTETFRTRGDHLLRTRHEDGLRISAQLESCQKQLEQVQTSELNLRNRDSAQRAEISRLEQIVQELRGSSQQSDALIREDLRQRNKEMHELRLELVAAEQRSRELEARCERLATDNERTSIDAARQEKNLRDLLSKYDALRSTATQDKIILDDTKSELARHITLVSDLRDEIQHQERLISDYQSKLDSTLAELRLAEDTSAQTDRLQQTLLRKQSDIDASEAQLSQLRMQLSQSEQQVASLQETVHAGAQMEALASGRAITIEKLRAETVSLRGYVVELEATISTERGNVSQARAELQAERDARMRADVDSRRLQEELQQIPALEETIGSLNDALSEHRSIANRALIECRSWQSKCDDLESRLDAFDEIENELRQTRDDNCRLASLAEERGTSIKICEQQLAAEAVECRRLEEALARERSTTTTMDQELRRLLDVEAESQQTESRFRQSQTALQARSDELSKERERTADLQLRLKERELAFNEERNRRSEAEAGLQQVTKEVSSLQGEIGKLTVALDAAAREKNRFEKEAQHKTQIAEQRLHHGSQLEATVAELQEDLRRQALMLRDANSDRDRATAKEVELTRAQELLREENGKLTAAVQQLHNEASVLHGKLNVSSVLQSRIAGMEAEMQRKSSELHDALRALQECRESHADVCNENSILKRVETRSHDVEIQLARSQQMLLNFEADVAGLSSKLVEKEKEMWKLRESLSAATTELDVERSRRATAEAKLDASDADRDRASQLEGQLAGLTIIAQARAKDLEGARASADELREKLRRLERNTVQRGAESVQLVVRELEAKVAARDQAISQLETDAARKDSALDLLREKVTVLDSQRKSVEGEAAKYRAMAERAEVVALQRQMDLERATDEALKQSTRSAALSRAGDELADLKHRNAQLQVEVAAKQREIDALEGRLRDSSVRRSASIESELRRTKMLLESTSVEKNQTEAALREKQRELEIASGNIETLRSRVRGESQRWSEKRKELSLLDEERAREYAAISQDSVAL